MLQVSKQQGFGLCRATTLGRTGAAVKNAGDNRSERFPKRSPWCGHKDVTVDVNTPSFIHGQDICSCKFQRIFSLLNPVFLPNIDTHEPTL